MPARSKAAAAAALLLAASAPGTHHVHAFVHPSRPLARKTLPRQTHHSGRHRQLEMWNPLNMFATADTEGIKKDVLTMKLKEIRDELQSYGISTKSFFEKNELVDALVKARKEGKTPVADKSSTTEKPPPKADVNAANRHDKIQAEMEKCQKMTVKELKKELDSYGVDHHFFEKSEFVKAVAEARVDGLKKTTQQRKKSTGFGSTGRTAKEEPYDRTYRDVVVRKLEDNIKAGLLLDGSIIDVTARSDFQ